MRRHFPTLRETLLRPRMFLFQNARIEERLSEEEHIELNIKLFKGLSEALAFLKPYMKTCRVFASRFEVEGSMTRFEMVRVRSPEKFIHEVHMGFFEDVKDGILTEDEVKSYEPLVHSALAKTGNPELVPEELKKAGAPRAVIAVVEESIPSDIDTTLYMGYRSFNGMLQFRRLLETTMTYSDFHGRNVNVHTKTSEIASAYTRPHPTWIKIMPV
jgi:hypothetical protein